MEEDSNVKELHRRSLVKSLLWRVIGVVWTWIGAYIILLFVPPSRKSAAFIATLIVVYHHSTRMIMYYAYERIWGSVKWGRNGTPRPMSAKEKILWTAGTFAALIFIFFLLLEVHPKIKDSQSADKGVHFSSESRVDASFRNE
ncbi:MAG: DUF2061 domain-containing protein [Thermodesulfobacteriota bacterium]|nr:DUF2061 domain-containing protein [Thermodesulfobacteriota bacterium]